MKKLTLVLLIALLVPLSCTKDDSLKQINKAAPVNQVPTLHAPGKSAIKMTSPVFNGVTGDEVGSAQLVRNANGITANFSANDLTPGFAYTIWWVIWNIPELCGTPNACTDADFGNADDVQVEVMYAGGHVVGNSGFGKFSGHLNEDDASGSINDLFGLPSYGGLQDALGAEVHVVLRNHGPAVPGLVNEQIGSYPGGCETDLGVFVEIPDEVGECGDTHFAIFAPPE